MKIVFILLLAVSLLLGCGDQGVSEYNKGVEFQQSGKIDLAEQQYKLALQNNPNLAEAHLNLGMIYLGKEWWQGAEESTKKAISIFERTNTTIIQGGTVSSALSLCYNNLGVARVSEGIAAEIKGDFNTGKQCWQEAMSHFKKAVHLDPGNANANANLNKFGNAY